MEESQNRREFLVKLATVAGGVVLVPHVIACGGKTPTPDQMADETDAKKLEEDAAAKQEEARNEMMEAAGDASVPKTKPANWDPIGFNKGRGNAGAIPQSYLGDINGPDGEKQHLGKHLPYIPELDPALVPTGYVALMWGDPEKGYARHPNAPRTEDNPEGHWYDWIRIRKAVDGETEELQSNFVEWPGDNEEANGAYAVSGGGKLTDDSGKNTVYLCALPDGLQKGDTVRIWAHCLTHGEYVDFITV